MAQIDRVKEILSTLRVAFSVVVGIILLLIGGLVGRYDDNKVDAVFWLGVVITSLCIVVLIFLINKLAKKTKEIGDM